MLFGKMSTGGYEYPYQIKIKIFAKNMRALILCQRAIQLYVEKGEMSGSGRNSTGGVVDAEYHYEVVNRQDECDNG